MEDKKITLDDMPRLEEIQSAIKVIKKTCQAVMSETDCKISCPLYSRDNNCCGMDLEIDKVKINELDKPPVT